jgi:Flp pilus assembly protein TadD
MKAPALVSLLLALGSACLGAQQDPFALPATVKPFAMQVVANHQGTASKLRALLQAMFKPQEQGGLGIVYENSRTRTLEEVWNERKANCLSMTAFFVATCRSIGLDAKYAEALNTNRWRKVGPIIRFERHVVALSPLPPKEDLVADFIPSLRRRTGFYVVALLSESRFRALYHSNRAVELLSEGRGDEARKEAEISLAADPKCGMGWNIQGVVLAARDDLAGAEKAYRAALALDPRDSTAIGNMEILLRSLGRTEEAARYRLLGEEVRKKDPYFNAFLAEESLAEGNVEEAQRRIHVALGILPHEPEFFLLQARLRLLQGRMDDAVKDIQEAKRWASPGERERYDSKLALIREKGQAEGR